MDVVNTKVVITFFVKNFDTFFVSESNGRL